MGALPSCQVQVLSGALSRLRTVPLIRCVFLLATMAGLGVGTLAAQIRGGGRWNVWGQPPGFSVALGYGADVFLPARGGLSNDPVALDNLDLLLHLNLSGLSVFRGTSVRLHVQSNRGSSVSSEVGDLQGISNLEAEAGWRLYEAWIEQQIGFSRLSILAGVYDLNSEFDVIPAAGDFLNGSFGFGPEFSLSGMAGPSTYPNTALAARVKVRPLPSFYGLLAVSDGYPSGSGGNRFTLDADEGALVSFEVGYTKLSSVGIPGLNPGRRMAPRGQGISQRQRRRIGRGRLIDEVSTKVGIGGWAYTGKLASWTPHERPGRCWGLYLLAEQLLYQDREGTGALSGFARVGAASDEVDQLDLSLKGGLAYRGLLPTRPDDVAGLGISHARNGSPFLREQRGTGIPMDRGETVVELMYRAEIGPFLVMEPDLQWVMNPGMDPEVADALVFGLRGHLLLELPGRDQGS